MKIYVALLLSASAVTAYAALGSAPAALGPRVLSHAAVQGAKTGGAYTDRKQTLATGTEVHEYLDGAGTVFAVSWAGPFLPDLKEVLGVHFQAMVDHVHQHPGSGARAQLRLQSDDVVIFSGGRPGAFEGRAWVPALLPAGFDTNAVR